MEQRAPISKRRPLGGSSHLGWGAPEAKVMVLKRNEYLFLQRFVFV